MHSDGLSSTPIDRQSGMCSHFWPFLSLIYYSHSAQLLPFHGNSWALWQVEVSVVAMVVAMVVAKYITYSYVC